MNKKTEKLSLEAKVCQLTQTNAVFVNADTQAELTGLPEQLDLSQKQIYELGSVLNFGDIKSVQDKYLSRSENKIPLIFMMDVIHGCRTIFPVPLAMGCAFDEELVEACAEMSAVEAKYLGIAVTFSPMVDLVRDARWGRVMESTGEDPYLNGRMGRAFIRGYHKGGIGACVKHFAGYGAAEAGRDYNTTDISDRSLKEFYLYAYRECLKENPEMVMTSFNLLNGIPVNGHTDLLVDMLRGEWGFDGTVISDYSGIKEMIAHGYAENEKECARIAANNQVDIEMMSSSYIRYLPELVREGKVKEETVDKMLGRVLALKEKFGLFENPYFQSDEQKEAEVSLCEKHRTLARVAAEKSCVLLKNDGVLPLGKKTRIALIGPFAEEGNIIGAWSCYGKAEETVTVKAGIENLLKRKIPCAKGCGYGLSETDESGFEAAEKAAESAESIVVCLGEYGYDSGEGASRSELNLPQIQLAMLRRLSGLNKPLVGVIFGGRPQILTEAEKYLSAILYAWQPGTEGGNAIARVLYGEVSPSGKLTMSFPRRTGQCPIYYNSFATGRPRNPDTLENCRFSSAYIDELNAPLYPFGYGLSYTKFAFSKPKIDRAELTKGESARVSVFVKNIGAREGDTTAQLYLRDDYASCVRPIKELRGYQKVSLKAGEEREVAFEITEEMLKFYTAKGAYEAESGSFTAYISESSDVRDGVGFVFRADL